MEKRRLILPAKIGEKEKALCLQKKLDENDDQEEIFQPDLYISQVNRMLQAKNLSPLLHLIFIGDVEDSANELVKPEYLANELVKWDVEGLVVKFRR